jgi:hypothetical protein
MYVRLVFAVAAHPSLRQALRPEARAEGSVQATGSERRLELETCPFIAFRACPECNEGASSERSRRILLVDESLPGLSGPTGQGVKRGVRAVGRVHEAD